MKDRHPFLGQEPETAETRRPGVFPVRRQPHRRLLRRQQCRHPPHNRRNRPRRRQDTCPPGSTPRYIPLCRGLPPVRSPGPPLPRVGCQHSSRQISFGRNKQKCENTGHHGTDTAFKQNSLVFVGCVLTNPDLAFNFDADPDPLRLLAKHKDENFTFGSGSKDPQIRVTVPDSSIQS